MLFMRRNVPAKMPEVSANASFCGAHDKWGAADEWSDSKVCTHHLAELHSRFTDLVTNANGNLCIKMMSLVGGRDGKHHLHP
jgi:hypothetical protein